MSPWQGFQKEQARVADDDRIARRQGKRWEAEEWVRAWLENRAPWLLLGVKPPENGQKIIAELLQEIAECSSAEDARLRRNFLIRGIERGVKEKRWTLKVPQQTLRVPLPRPAITEKNFPQIARVDRLRDAFLQSLLAPGFPDLSKLMETRHFARARARLTDDDLQAGQALLAAILFGGVTNKTRLLGLAQVAPNRLAVARNMMWIEWPKFLATEMGLDQWERWHSEKVSGFLLAKAHRGGLFPLVRPTGNVEAADAIWKRIDAVLFLLPISPGDRPNTLGRLLEWATTWTHFRIPPFLAAYACGRISSASLKPEAHLRLMLGAAAPLPEPRSDLAGQDDDGSQLPPPRRPKVSGSITADIGIDNKEIVADLRSAVKNAGEKHQAIKQINKFLKRTDIPPAAVRLAEWVRELCDHHRDGQARRRLSSIHDYVAKIDRPLVVGLEGRDPASMDAPELEAMYDEVLANMKPSVAASAVHPLRLFHHHLVAAHGVPDDVGQVFEGYSKDAAVDAAMISEGEHREVLSRLAPGISAHPGWLSQMHQVAEILGYRYDLRRGEVRRLRFGDLCGAVFGVLYVRSTEHGRVKSRTSTRNLTFDGHVPEGERQIVRQFIITRLKQISGSDDIDGLLNPYQQDAIQIRSRPLFEHPGQPGALVPDQTLFDPVVKVMAQVTMDPDSHFHLLRKGGLNFELMALMEEELPGCSDFLSPDGEIRAAARQLHESLLGNWGPDNRKLWAVAAEAGHASPGTTNGSYLHVLGPLLSHALDQCTEDFDVGTISAQTGLTDNNIRVLRATKNIRYGDWLYWVGHKHREWRKRVTIEPRVHSASATPGTPAPPIPDSFDTSISGVDVLSLLEGVFAEGNEVEVEARKIGADLAEATCWVRHAERLTLIVGKSPAAESNLRVEQVVAAHGLRINRPVSILPQLRQSDERERLNRWTKLLAAEAWRNPDQTARWLNEYWSCRHPRDFGIRFRSTERAKAFLGFLRTAIPEVAPKICARHTPLASGSLDAEGQLQQWAVASQIDVRRVALGEPQVRQMDGDRLGTLSIYIGIEQGLSRETLKRYASGFAPRNAWVKSASAALDRAAYILTLWMLSGKFSCTTMVRPPHSTTGQELENLLHAGKDAKRQSGKKRDPDRVAKMEMVILCGIPAAGKTTIRKEKYPGHVCVSLDAVGGSKAREWEAFTKALANGDNIIIDNMNLTAEKRRQYIAAGKTVGYRIVGLLLNLSVREAIRRNNLRGKKIPEAAIFKWRSELQPLSMTEGFDDVQQIS